MATDITIEASTTQRRAVAFESFLIAEFDALARAVAVVVGDDHVASSVTEEAARATYRRWKSIGFDDQPSRDFYRSALNRAVSSNAQLPELAPASSSVPHVLLGWPLAKVATVLGIPTEVATGHLNDELARVVRSQAHVDIADRLAPADALRLDYESRAAATVITLRPAELALSERRRRTRNRMSVAAAALFAIVGISSLAASIGPDPQQTAANAEELLAEPTPTPTAIPTPAPVPTPSRSLSFAPRADLELSDLSTSTLMTVDATGTFWIATTEAFPSVNDAVFLKSDDGTNWQPVGAFDLDPTEYIERFEYSGKSFVVWIRDENVPADSGDEATTVTIATSPDLRDWKTQTLSLADRIPDGLIFDSMISDVAIVGDDVLAMVRTAVNIDFASQELYESNTCGSSIEPDRAVIRLCSGSALEVFRATPESAQLPAPYRLYLSQGGKPFLPVESLSFRGDLHLRNSRGLFTVDQINGRQTRVSRDGLLWEGANDRPTLESAVRVAATDSAGDKLSLSVGAEGATLWFEAFDPTVGFVATSVADVIGVEPTRYNASITVGAAGWLVDIQQENGTSWLLFSYDGRNWQLLEVPEPHSPVRRAYVGSSAIIVESNDDDRPAFTTLPL